MKTTDAAPRPKKSDVDRNMTGLAGELFVAAELLKCGLQTSITFGNAKQIDLLAHNSYTGRTFTIQVKALRVKGYFPMRLPKPEHIYVFVVLNKPGEAVEYFIVSGNRLLAERQRFDFEDPKFPGLYTKDLVEFKDAWDTFVGATEK
jgi:hypothetical protein